MTTRPSRRDLLRRAAAAAAVLVLHEYVAAIDRSTGILVARPARVQRSDSDGAGNPNATSGAERDDH